MKPGLSFPPSLPRPNISGTPGTQMRTDSVSGPAGRGPITFLSFVWRGTVALSYLHPMETEQRLWESEASQACLKGEQSLPGP